MVRRSSDIRGTGISQAALRFGREMELPTELTINGGRNQHEEEFTYIRRLRQAIGQASETFSNLTAAQRKKDETVWRRAMQDYQEKELEVGEYVMMYTPTCETGLRPKLVSMWRAPYEIIERTSPMNYRVRHTVLAGNGTQVVHAHRLKRYWPRQDGQAQVREHQRARQLELEADQRDGAVLGIPAIKIIDNRKSKSGMLYRVRFQGQPPSQDTWETGATMATAPHQLNDYLTSKGMTGSSDTLAVSGGTAPTPGRGMLEGAAERNDHAEGDCGSELNRDATTAAVSTTYLLARAPTGSMDSCQGDQQDQRLVTEQDLAIRSNLVF
jgi:hypothetical protein